MSDLPYFASVLPFPSTMAPGSVLEQAQERAKSTTKYQFTDIKVFSEFEASAHVRFGFREAVREELAGRVSDWEEQDTLKKVVEYLFFTAFEVSIDCNGLLKARFPIPDGWDEDSLQFLYVELESQLFNVSKFIVQVLQENHVLPQDFEFKRYTSRLSTTPTLDLVDLFEKVIADAHTDVCAMAVEVFEETETSLLHARQRRFFPLSLFSPVTLDSEGWIQTKREAFVQRSLISWYYWLLWHGLEEERRTVETSLNGRLHSAYADLNDVEHQSEQFISQRTAISTELGALFGVIGVSLAIGLAAVTWIKDDLMSFGTPLTSVETFLRGALLMGHVFVAVLAALIGFFWGKTLKANVVRTFETMTDDAKTLREVFRWNHPKKDE